jgi:hypothetical protein
MRCKLWDALWTRGGLYIPRHATPFFRLEHLEYCAGLYIVDPGFGQLSTAGPWDRQLFAWRRHSDAPTAHNVGFFPVLWYLIGWEDVPYGAKTRQHMNHATQPHRLCVSGICEVSRWIIVTKTRALVTFPPPHHDLYVSIFPKSTVELITCVFGGFQPALRHRTMEA